VMSLARAHLVELRNAINGGVNAYGDKMSRYHLQDVLNRIETALDPKK
jgi:hypothetical protein